MGRHYDDPLEFILDGVAESETEEACTGLTPSKPLRRQWTRFEEQVSDAMLAWGDSKNLGDEIARIIQDEEHYAFDVYMTLDGAGVGIWDGRWDPYLTRAQIEDLQHYLVGKRVYSSQGALGEAYNTLQTYLHDDVYAQCRGRRAKGEKLDPTLNGAEDQPDCRHCERPYKEGHEYHGGQLCCKRWSTVYSPMRSAAEVEEDRQEYRTRLPSWAKPR